MDNLTQISSLMNTLLLLCTLVGGFFAFKNARKAQTVKIQDETIQALQQQLDAMDRKIETLIEDKARQALIIETIQSALQQKGILITIDGEMVTIVDSHAQTSSSIRKPRTPPARVKKPGGTP